MDGILNLNIMRHWENWVIVTLMLAFALIFIDILVSGFSNQQGNS